MNSAVVVIVGGLVIFLAYRFYAKRIDERVIQPDPRAMTPAQAFEDGVDFVPTSRYVLYGYHFKSVAAAGPIVGVITAASIWGWVPSILWLMLGVTFIGWASDYSAIILSVRNEGHSLSGVAYRLIAPRTRSILYVFIFFYLLLIGGAFIGIMSAVMDARPDAPFGILMLALMGLLGGYLLYRTRVSIGQVTVLVVGVVLLAMALGPVGVGEELQWEEGPISGVVQSINQSVNEAGTLYTLVDPTGADPRIPPPDPETGERPTTPRFDAETGRIQVLPSFLLWAVFILAFCFLGARLAIWQFAQPVNYIGFWVTALVIGLGAIGAVLAVFTQPDVADFKIGAVAEGGGFAWFWPETPTAAIQPLWPMLFVTIACGAISGWHALFGSVGTSRQLEYETDALPVGGGGMFSENTLALLSLIAVGITGAAGAGGFATGVGQLLNVATFGLLEVPYGTALGFGAFILIVLTVTQLVFRLMRVTLAEWGGERSAAFRSPSSGTVLSMVAVLALVLTGTWVYLWQLFGAANQLMAALSLLLVTVWLKSVGRDWRYAGYPMVFMYVTTVAASLVTSYNLFATIVVDPATELPEQIGAGAMILIALLLVVAALIIARDAWDAWQRYGREEVEAGEAVRQP